MKRRIAATFALMNIFFAATSVYAASQEAEASMLVTGKIEVSQDGSIRSYTFDHPEKLQDVVTKVVVKAMTAWRFKVTSGKPVKADFSMRLVAKPVDGKQFRVGIAGVDVTESGDSANSVQSLRRRVIVYPIEAAEAGVGGTVYLLVQVGKDGSTKNVAAEQVNLTARGDEKDMKRYRDVLANAAIKTAKYWTYTIPTSGDQAKYSFWYVRIPVNFEMYGVGLPRREYGQWEAYVPGPRLPIAWLKQTPPYTSPDAIPAGGIAQVDRELTLLAPPEGP
ncbi:energy transducer TonB [Dyella sp.]|uniref:energy transducer TonB n=1 Tax=Dyella sp. TaxID=1869338 RepID=UPI002D76EA83|nr:energy transducer TonB [Dyella sp.]HET7332721.1 energy transducer TonB [Dyella sp.]